MRNRAILVCVAIFMTLARASAETPKWAELRTLIGVTKASPEFRDFVSRYALTERPSTMGNAARPDPPFFANGSGITVILDWDKVVSAVLISPSPRLDMTLCFPIPRGEPVTKAAVLSSLELTEASGENRGVGLRAYYNSAWGVGVMFRNDVLDLLYFYPRKPAPRKLP